MANQKLKKIKGGDMMLFVAGKPLAFATNHTLTVQAETQDTSNKDEGGGKWSATEVKLLSWNGKSENFYCVSDATAGKADDNSTYDDVFDLMIKGEAVDAIFAMKSESVNDISEVGTSGSTANKVWTPKAPKYTGKVIITNLEVSAQNGEYTTYSVDFTGVGELKKVAS